MLYINGNDIKLTRGDTALIDLVIYTAPPEDVNKKVYELQDGDSVYFAVRKYPKTGRYRDYLIEKEFKDLSITLESEDTQYLKYGQYFYDCTLYFANGEVNTILNGRFTLTSEIG